MGAYYHKGQIGEVDLTYKKWQCQKRKEMLLTEQKATEELVNKINRCESLIGSLIVPFSIAMLALIISTLAQNAELLGFESRQEQSLVSWTSAAATLCVVLIFMVIWITAIRQRFLQWRLRRAHSRR